MTTQFEMAYGSQYIFSGVSHPRSQRIVTSRVTPVQLQRAGDVSSAALAPQLPL
jgi:hypothetical protein